MKVILTFLFLINLYISAVHAQNLPCKSIQECVDHSGGAYAVVNSLNPDSTHSLVDQIQIKGLTNSDENYDSKITPNLKIYKKLIKDLISSMSYDGQQGEEISIDLESDNFIPRLFILNEKGSIIAGDTNDQRKKSLNLKLKLMHTGKYEIQVMEKDDSQDGSFYIKVYSVRKN